MSQPALERILEAALQAAGKPLSLERMRDLFDEDRAPSQGELRQALERLAEDCAGRSVELREVASGWRLQVRDDYAPWVGRLWEERPQRYSRALLETLSLIAYRQPITRGEIEDVRGVAVSSQTIRTLLEREWVRVVGHKDVPGRPAMYATTRQFLDYFNLRSLAELPPLAELRELVEEELPAPAAPSEPASETAAWIPMEPLAADEPDAGGDFNALLDELNAMETDLKTDFDDLLPEDE
ncbi:SMC-Scp complex subunit ScpB [Pseudomonas sp. MYb185]|uniref:SMC-Scp complex subunit ScpB n=1 Tax=Pseudomonas sp. MYb185 TaxID=1848729 RepID=UPI000CFD8FB7|nr:SMC-Scp complex subunit ScpB [Pseudomonas sp. MYb185]PRB80612.1 SMC-Scp complex subunit ScpB [Pseudomonas sp. MYb185]